MLLFGLLPPVRPHIAEVHLLFALARQYGLQQITLLALGEAGILTTPLFATDRYSGGQARRRPASGLAAGRIKLATGPCYGVAAGQVDQLLGHAANTRRIQVRFAALHLGARGGTDRLSPFPLRVLLRPLHSRPWQGEAVAPGTLVFTQSLITWCIMIQVHWQWLPATGI